MYESNIDAWWAQADNEQWHRHVLQAQEFANYLQHEGLMKVSELTAGKYLAKADFEDDQTCTIKGIRTEELDDNGTKKEKTVCYFREHAKGMILNITSLRVLAQVFGDETDDWRGKQVIVYTDPNVSFGGKVVGGLRLRIPKQKATPTPSKAPTEEDFNDDVPF